MRTQPVSFNDSPSGSSRRDILPGSHAGSAPGFCTRRAKRCRRRSSSLSASTSSCLRRTCSSPNIWSPSATSCSPRWRRSLSARRCWSPTRCRYLRRYDRAPLIQPILYKTAFYWVIVFFARLLERFVHFSLEGNPPGDFIPLFDHDLLVAPVFRHFPVDPRPLPDLCDGIGIQPSFRPRRAAAAIFHPPAVRAAAQSATTDARAIAAEPACRRALRRVNSAIRPAPHTAS